MGKSKRQSKRRKIQIQWGKGALYAGVIMVLTILGVYFAGRSNLFDQSQVNSRIYFVDKGSFGASYQGGNPTLIVCAEAMQLRNTAVAPDRIVGYDTLVYFQGTTSRFSGSGWSTDEYSLPELPLSYPLSEELRNAITSLRIKVGPVSSFAEPGRTIEADIATVGFPYPIVERDAFNWGMSVAYNVHPDNEYNLYVNGQQILGPEPSALSPLEFELEFKLVSGEVIKTPRINCGGVGLPARPTPLPHSRSSLSNITVNPPSPAKLDFGQQIDITFDYTTDEECGVLILAMPTFAAGEPIVKFNTNPSNLYPTGRGSGTDFVRVTSGECRIDKIVIQMWTADQSVLLYEFPVRAVYDYGN